MRNYKSRRSISACIFESSTVNSGRDVAKSATSSSAWNKRIFAMAYSSVPVNVRPVCFVHFSSASCITKMRIGNIVLRSAET